METCKTCEHFKVEHNHPYDGRLGSCARWHVGYSIPLKDVADNEVLVENDEGWGMMVGPDFGCILHKPTKAI